MSKVGIKKFVDVCLNEKNKADTKLNKNYYFIATIFFIALNISIFAIFGLFFHSRFQSSKDIIDWDDALNFTGFFSAFISNITHFDWNHVLLNMVPSFLVVSIYLERKFGSLKYFGIVSSLILISAAFVSGNNQSLNYAGFSCVNFALYAFFIITLLFSLNFKKEGVGNVVFGCSVFIIVLVLMFWNIGKGRAGSSSASDLVFNLGHYSGFLSGIIVGLVINLTRYFVRRDSVAKVEVEKIAKKERCQRILKAAMGAVCMLLIITTSTLSLIASSNKTIKVHLHSTDKQIERLNLSYKLNQQAMYEDDIINALPREKYIGYTIKTYSNKYKSIRSTGNTFDYAPIYGIDLFVDCYKNYNIKFETVGGGTPMSKYYQYIGSAYGQGDRIIVQDGVVYNNFTNESNSFVKEGSSINAYIYLYDMLEKVLVNGEEKETNAGNLKLENIQSDIVITLQFKSN